MISIEELYSIYKSFPSVQTDTRKLAKNDLFFALKGDNFNGNLFAKSAIEQGAAYAIVDEPGYAQGGNIILVKDVLTALQQLAAYHRKQFTIPFIGITGSNGKTTTKELIHAVLSSTFTTYTTQGNLNNHIGIPLTLLKIKEDAQMAVIEMGANHLREIAGYCEYARPTHGLITNCGKAHLEGFGSIEGVRKGKGELYDFIRENGGTIFRMNDYDYLLEMSHGIRDIITYGTDDSDIVGKIINDGPFLTMQMEKGLAPQRIETQLVGDYNIPNVLAAIAVAKTFNVAEKDIKIAIESYNPSNGRSQLVNRDSNHFILDAYNANPASMKVAIENFAAMAGNDKILMLGGMAELGNDSLAEHQLILDIISKYLWKEVIVVGGDFLKIKHPYRAFTNSLEAKTWLQHQQFENTYFLIKGSRSMQMEKLIS